MQRGFLREHGSIGVACYVIADLVAIAAGGVLAFQLRFGTAHVETSYRTAVVLGLLLALLIFPRFNLYDSWRGRNYAVHLRSLVMAWVLVGLGLVFIAYVLKDSEKFSRAWFAYWGCLSAALIVAERFCVTFVLRRLRARGWNQRTVAVVGSGHTPIDLIRRVGQSRWSGLRVTHMICTGAQIPNLQKLGVQVERGIEQIGSIGNGQTVDEVWICLPTDQHSDVKAALELLRHSTATIRFIPDTSSTWLIQHPVTEMLGVSMLNLSVSPMGGVNRLFKAIEDRVLAGVILAMISPLLVIVAAGVKLTSPGPVFFRQKRVGWNGKDFTILKFRSMPVNTEAATGPKWAESGEQRATRFGAFLRRTSLDELPQFINVIRGDMSIVGPRPERPVFVNKFKDEVPHYMQKHLVKAGITGWAQINGWRGNTDLRKRIEHDLFYIENWSVWFDLKIILLTVFKGFVNKNAY